ncbi:hypothetical protein LCGC14_3020080 [marine sediment metagenome]|uniref:Uncharacterized protein n=1 Tax=marine sediment metagenome TaxID=412755 RepID=A0A0F8WW61_9ZZZZ
MAKDREIEQSFETGYIRTKVHVHEGKAFLHFWATDEAGRDCQTTIITNAAGCRGLADTLRDYAEELDQINGQNTPNPEGK